jgi:hypothetical protein
MNAADFAALTSDQLRQILWSDKSFRCSMLEDEEELRSRLANLSDMHVEYLLAAYQVASQAIPSAFLSYWLTSTSEAVRKHTLAALANATYMTITEDVSKLVRHLSETADCPIERGLARQAMRGEAIPTSDHEDG